MAYQEIKLYQAGTFVVGNRLLDPDQRSVQARTERSNALTSGHRACQGCGEALGARYVLDAAMRATDGELIATNATGCLEVFSTPYPRVLLAARLDPLAVRQRTGGRHRRRGGAQGEGPRGRARDRPGRRRRHARHRLRLPLGDVRAKRRRAVHLLRQRGLHEHRGPALRRDAAGGADREHEAARRPARQRLRQGQERAADRDGARDPLRGHRDRRRAARPRGTRSSGRWSSAAPATSTSSCPARSAGDRRPATRSGSRGWSRRRGLFPVFEAEDGEVVGVSKIRRPVPVEEYLKLQRRYAHLFGDPPRDRRDRADPGDRRPQHPATSACSPTPRRAATCPARPPNRRRPAGDRTSRRRTDEQETNLMRLLASSPHGPQ